MCLLIFSLELISQNSWGWGFFAHRAIAEITEKNLTPEARKWVKDLLGTQTFEEAAVWADNVREVQNWKHTKYYHYKNIGDTDYFQDLEHLSEKDRKKGDVLRAILRAEDVLREASSSQDEKRTALRFLIHFVADLHQPLHVGYKEDIGGNGASLTWYGKKTNLHALWDTGLIYKIMEKEENLTKPTPSDFVKTISPPTPQQWAQWKKSGMLDWFNESLEARGPAYVNYKTDNDAYYKKSAPVIKLRIAQSAYRLAHLLHLIATAPNVTTQDAVQLRDHVLPYVNFDISYLIRLQTQTN